MRHIVKVPRSPSLARGRPSRGAPVSASLANGVSPAIATFMAVATPVVGEVAKIIPLLLDEFMKAVTTGVEDGLRELASTKVFRD